MTTFTLPPLAAAFQWHTAPQNWAQDNGTLSITAQGNTDWFIDPKETFSKTNAPIALCTPPDANFLLSAKVTVDFKSMYDAGVLFLFERDNVWGKLCFEYSPQKQPMVVSVVTREFSDDCNSTVIEGNSVYLRVLRDRKTFAFHYSLDGRYWHMVRYFTLGALDNLRVGFSAQSPTGEGCTASFSEISYREGVLTDYRSGE